MLFFPLPLSLFNLVGKTSKSDLSLCSPGTMTGGGSKVMKGRMGSSVVVEISEEEVSQHTQN